MTKQAQFSRTCRYERRPRCGKNAPDKGDLDLFLIAASDLKLGLPSRCINQPDGSGPKGPLPHLEGAAGRDRTHVTPDELYARRKYPPQLLYRSRYKNRMLVLLTIWNHDRLYVLSMYRYVLGTYHAIVLYQLVLPCPSTYFLPQVRTGTYFFSPSTYLVRTVH